MKHRILALLTQPGFTLCLTVLASVILFAPSVRAAPGGRLPATGGVNTIDGSGGGGLSPWALISGYDTPGEIDVNAFATVSTTQDYRLKIAGLAVGFFDRVELSAARAEFDLDKIFADQTLKLDSMGLKWRIAGDAVFAPDSWLPQVALGAEWKRIQTDLDIQAALSVKDKTDHEWYISASKLYFAALFGHNLLLNATTRYTRANQFGLLGFGGDKNDQFKWQGEFSAGVFLTDTLVLGAEYRQKPDNLSNSPEQAARDAFLAWFPNKRLSVTLARVDLGEISPLGLAPGGQAGPYVSVQLVF